MNDESNRKTHVINKCLKDWCHQHNFGVFEHGATLTASHLLESDGLHLSSEGKRILTPELAGLVERALNYI